VRAALGEAGLAVWLKRWKSILFEAVILCVGEGGSWIRRRLACMPRRQYPPHVYVDSAHPCEGF